MDSEIIKNALLLASSKYGIPFNQKQLNKCVKKFEEESGGEKIEKFNAIKKKVDRDEYTYEFSKSSINLFKNQTEFDFSFFLIQSIKSIPTGDEYWYIYQKLASIFICEVFDEELTDSLSEVRGSQGSQRYDLVCYNSAKSGFWDDMKNYYKILTVKFEFKNCKENDHIELAQQLGRYADKNQAIVLVTRKYPSEIIFKELGQLFRRIRNFLPLAISDKELQLAYILKKKGLSPSEIFKKPYLRLQTA